MSHYTQQLRRQGGSSDKESADRDMLGEGGEELVLPPSWRAQREKGMCQRQQER